jgi:hypothetical protein
MSFAANARITLLRLSDVIDAEFAPALPVAAGIFPAAVLFHTTRIVRFQLAVAIVTGYCG